MLAAGIDAEVGLGVADIDDKQHARITAVAARLGAPPGPVPSACQALGQPVAVGQAQLRVELEQRHQHEAARADLGVGQRQPLGADTQITQQQDVDVDHPRAMPGAAGGAADLALNRLARVEQVLRVERRSRSADRR